MFLKLKALASDYPGLVHTPEDEERYLELFSQSEEIRPDKQTISYNATKRRLAKLYLKSMWDKLTQRNDRSMTKIIKEPKELYKFLSSPGIEVTNLVFASDDVVWIKW